MSRAATIFWSIMLLGIIIGFSWVIWWSAAAYSFCGKMAFEAVAWVIAIVGSMMAHNAAIPVRIVK